MSSIRTCSIDHCLAVEKLLCVVEIAMGRLLELAIVRVADTVVQCFCNNSPAAPIPSTLESDWLMNDTVRDFNEGSENHGAIVRSLCILRFALSSLLWTLLLSLVGT